MAKKHLTTRCRFAGQADVDRPTVSSMVHLAWHAAIVVTMTWRLIHTPRWVLVLLRLYGGLATCTDGLARAWIARLAPASGQSSAQDLCQGASGGDVLVVGVWGAWNGDGHRPLLAAGTVGAIVVLGMSLSGKRLNTGTRPAWTRVAA